MIVKIHSRGTGGGNGPVDYLLGTDRKREQACVLRGDPERVSELIDSCEFARTYTSGVLSFQESDLPDTEKGRLMDEWERTLMTGLDKDQYACLWVQHQDKGRLELNFVIPNKELQSGKRLQPYFDRADRPRVNAWQTLTNDRLGLHDPNDPANRRALTPSNDLPRNKQQATEAITKGLINLIKLGEISDRKGVISHLNNAGLNVVRETKSSISIADPSGGQNIRLKGVLYERDFKFSAGVREQIETASKDYRAERQDRVRDARNVYQRGLEIKHAEHTARYQRPDQTADQPITPDHRKNMGYQHTSDPDPIQYFSWDSLVSRAASDRASTRAHAVQPDIERPEGQHRSWISNTAGQKTQKAVFPDFTQERAHRGSVHLRQQESDHSVQSQIASHNATKTILSDFKYKGEENHDRDGKTASGRIRELAAALRATASGMAGQLQQFTAHVRDYLAGAGEKQQSLSDLEQSGAELGKASQQLERECQTIKQTVMQKEQVKHQERAHHRDNGMSL